jgi:hypothetical protein
MAGRVFSGVTAKKRRRRKAASGSIADSKQ